MKYSYTSALTAATLITSSLAGVVPSEPWTTLTPSANAPKGATTDYTATFGVAVVPITGTTTSGSSTSTETGSATSKAKRDVISQIGDGQIQASTATPSTTAKSTAQAISQIGDGQIQATTKTSSAAPKSTAQAISQIGDGQIQATTATSSASPKSTAQAISQIGDGQIQATTKTSSSAGKSTATAISQINDGQVQATNSSKSNSSATGSESALASATASQRSSDDNVKAVSCKNNGSLALTLKGSVLTDSKGRIGSVVANRQFQFDGPPPQAGAIYAAGWSITEEGVLALGDSDKFYQCLSGNFYNLYDEHVGDQCKEIKLEVIELIDC